MLETQVYTVGTPYESYMIPPFTYDDPNCAGSEEFSNNIVTPNTWITGVNDNQGNGSTVGW